ncbi:hypothetical protein IAT40_004500 [Kwoniella sp. CBS 6097]
MSTSNRSSITSDPPAFPENASIALALSWERSRMAREDRSFSVSSTSSGRVLTSHSGQSNQFDLEPAADFEVDPSLPSDDTDDSMTTGDPRDLYGPQGSLGAEQVEEIPPPRYNRLSSGPPEYSEISSSPSPLVLQANTASRESDTSETTRGSLLAHSRRSEVANEAARSHAFAERPPSSGDNRNGS